MKTREEVERENAQRFGDYHEDTNSWDELESAKEYVECYVCGYNFEPEEIHEADLFDDGKKHSLCDKHYEIYLEEN